MLGLGFNGGERLIKVRDLGFPPNQGKGFGLLAKQGTELKFGFDGKRS